MKICFYRWGDWCHNPKFDEQEECPYYKVAQDESMCKCFKDKESK